MRHHRLKLCTILLFGLVLTIDIQAQKAIPATGSNASGNDGSVSYTVGQIFYTTSTGTNGSVAEGVQQPYEISVVVGIEQAKDINLTCTAYPNPTTDLLTLEVEIADNENLFYQLYDMMGKLMVSKKLIDIRTTIPMANLAPATYFLKVTDNQKVVKHLRSLKTSKIIIPMKKSLTLITVVLLTATVWAQSPEKMSYQAVIRNNSNDLVTKVIVGMKISILQGSVEGTIVYTETQSPETNANGLVSIEIGTGTTSYDFSTIDWTTGPYYIKTETDLNGGANYTIIGISQLLSVPYALYSKIAGNVFSGNYHDLTNQPVLFDGMWGSITGTPTTLTGYGITDGMNTSHVANGITSSLITNWNTAFSWGDHDGLYRPIGYVPAWNEITGRPTFAAVATSGSYTDLTNTPTITGSQWTTSGSDIYYNTGNVGVGTGSPATYLHAHGSPVSNRGQLSLSAPSGEGIFLSLYDANIYKAYLWYNVGDEDLHLQNVTDGDLILNHFGGNVGVGTNAPEFRLTLDNDGGIIAKGVYESGNTLVASGEGTRLIWYPRKAAFRAGYVEGSEWDDANIGNYSTAVGRATIASGNISTAMGLGTDANGYNSTATGHFTTANGYYSTAMGYQTDAEAYACVVLGRWNLTSSSYSANPWVNTDPLFIIGNGTSGSERHNAVLVRKDGSVVLPDVYNDPVLTLLPYRDLYISSFGQIGYLASSLRYKKNISSMEDVSWLYQLRPVNFVYKSDDSEIKQYGLIAEEVEDVNPLFVSYNKDGEVETVSYSQLVSPMIKALQEQQQMIEELKARIEALENN